ncbi:MAG: LysR family transcriptional regulator [Candidatus Thiodiazotropha sp. (ex Lucinoma borealis)]|nr:LysR family transcriptional regulator [Candidatus Thiodiazotropha sp. (ex Lucinoma borealis)]
MRKIDYLSLDGHSLLVFVTVLEELSVTKAAERLSVTQSAVSHTLEKLRIALGDPLFVRSGRSIAATEQALGLLEPVRDVLDGMKSLTDMRDFDPTNSELAFTIAANDFQRSLIFPPLTKTLNTQSINARFKFLPARVPDAALLRQGHCDLVITPFPPEGGDIFQVRLFSDNLVCFYDGNVRKPPATKRELLSDNHLDVVFEDQGSVMHAVLSGLDLGKMPKSRISVPNFNAVKEFIFGTELITVQMERMAKTSLKGLHHAPLPFKTPKLPLFMAWHRRSSRDPAQVWLRELIKSFVS